MISPAQSHDREGTVY